jgi:hypothetical protein
MIVIWRTPFSLNNCFLLPLRKARESAKGLKWNPVDDLIFGDRSNTALYNSAILEHVAWAFMTSELRSRMVGRGITVTRVRQAACSQSQQLQIILGQKI